MSLKLVSFEYIPKKTNGWSSRKLNFGNTLTVAKGPNTTGKTPLLKGIIYSLGFPAELPKEVTDHCSEVVLEVVSENIPYTFIRKIADDVFISLSSGDNLILEARNLNDISEKVYELLGIKRKLLTTKGGNSSVYPYVDSILPAFWADQDIGWSDIYSVFKYKDYIKCQREEVYRLILDLEAKHPFVDKNLYEEAKSKLEGIQKALKVKGEVLLQLKIEKYSRKDEMIEDLKTKKIEIEKKINDINEKISTQEDGGIYYSSQVCIWRSKTESPGTVKVRVFA
jgi:DNA repair exonuclease SbcCD ATPase subunit